MSAVNEKIFPPQRCDTGVQGLDDILEGGLPSDRMYLLQGSPGVGKTTLALQFLRQGLENGEKILYITLSETKEELEAVGRSHGWDLTGIQLLEMSAIEQSLQGEADNTFFHPSDVALNRTTQVLLKEVEKVNPRRLVFDSLSEMRMMAETPARYRRQILHLKHYLAGRKCTTLFLDDNSDNRDLQIESIAHGVITMTMNAPEYGICRRQLSVRKIRGSKFQEGRHDYLINPGGIEVFPRLVAARHHRPFDPGCVSSGLTGVDELLGGGLDRGTSTMFLGPAGTGKSTLAAKFAVEAARRGEKVLWFIFDETVSILLARTKQLGLAVEEHVNSGLIRLAHLDPAEISPGEMTHSIREAVEKEGTAMLIVDSINGYLNAMPEERFLSLQLHELLAYLNQHGVVTIMVLAQGGVIGAMEAAVDLTYLSDTVVLLRYFELRGKIRQALSIMKKRSGNHERSIREITMGKGGIMVGPPLEDFHGVLTGVPTINLERPVIRMEGVRS